MALSSAQRRRWLFGAIAALAIFSGLVALRRSSPPSSVNRETTPVPSAASGIDAHREVPLTATPVSESNSGAAPGGLVNFQAAVNEARRILDPNQRAREFGRLLLLWLARDLEGAVGYVRRLPPGAEFTQGLLMALDAVGQRDPDRALTLARDLVVTREQRAFYSALFARLAVQDRAGAVQRLALVPAGEARVHAIRAILDTWTLADLSGALDWAARLSDPADRSVAFESTLSELSSTDPLRALALAQKSLTGLALERTLFKALHKLTETDPESAGAVARLLPAGETQTLAVVDAARALAARNPTDAVTWAGSLPGAELQRVAVNSMLDVWLQKDASAVRQYVAQLPAGAALDAAAGHVGRSLGGTELPAAIAWAQALSSDSAREAALVNIASAWAQKDAPAAARWARDFPVVTVQREALASALSYWVLQDAHAARDFVGALSGELQVQAVTAIAPSLAQNNPAAALAWGQSLSRPDAREAAVSAAFTRWFDNAPDAARAWLAAVDLPADLKTRLLLPHRG